MEKFDLIIVGAGPAGSTAAYYTEGLKVLIVDKCDFPRHKSCGGGLMSSKDWHLEFDNYKKIKEKINSACGSSRIKIYWNNIYVASRKFKHLFDQVDRYEFDNLLLQLALKKENVSFLKFDVQEIKEEKFEEERGIIISDGAKEIFAPYIIGADGVHSKVAKFLGNRNLKLREAGHCMEYDLRCEKITRDIRVSPGYKMEIGYSWIFPTSSGYQVGLGMVRKVRKSLKIFLDEYLDWAVKHKLIPERYEIKKVSGGVVPLRIAKKYATDRILLCGDAMGLVKLLIGEGIYYAMKSGKIAGQAISESRKNLKARYRKKIRPVIFEIFLTPYIPPKIFTLTFWTLFFMIGKYVDKLNVFNPIIDFFSRMAIHRQKTAESFYSDEKITK